MYKIVLASGWSGASVELGLDKEAKRLVPIWRIEVDDGEAWAYFTPSLETLIQLQTMVAATIAIIQGEPSIRLPATAMPLRDL